MILSAHSIMEVDGVAVKQIPHLPDYAASQDGRICRITPRRYWPQDASPWLTSFAGNKFGHLRVKAGGKPHLVHRLVLLAWVGQPDEKCECSHLDGDPKNNTLSNLAWETHAQNMGRRVEHGTTKLGEANGNSKLTADKVAQIKAHLSAGHSLTTIAREYAVSIPLIANIRDGKIWKSVQAQDVDGGSL